MKTYEYDADNTFLTLIFAEGECAAEVSHFCTNESGEMKYDTLFAGMIPVERAKRIIHKIKLAQSIGCESEYYAINWAISSLLQ